MHNKRTSGSVKHDTVSRTRCKYIDGVIGDVLDGHRLDDALTDGDLLEVERRASVVGDDDELRSHGGTVHLEEQRVVDTAGKQCTHAVLVCPIQCTHNVLV